MWKFTNKSRTCAYTMVLILLIFSLFFSGCAIVNHFWSDTEEPTIPSAPTLPTIPPVEYNNPMNLPTELLDALVDFLEEYHADHDLMGFSEEMKIDFIKQRKPAVHAAFDPSKYYFVCGYYKGDHDDIKESRSYCCPEEYEWVKYESADEIREYDNDAKMAVAFQINKALFVKDLMTGKEYPFFKEHFQLYTPKFVDGLNTNTPVHCSESFIYLNLYRVKEDPLYYSTSCYYHSSVTFTCIAKEEHYFMMLHWYHLNPDGQCTSTKNFELTLGKHYDSMMNIMCQETYSIPHITGAVNVYALVELNDFVEMISK